MVSNEPSNTTSIVPCSREDAQALEDKIGADFAEIFGRKSAEFTLGMAAVNAFLSPPENEHAIKFADSFLQSLRLLDKDAPRKLCDICAKRQVDLACVLEHREQYEGCARKG